MATTSSAAPPQLVRLGGTPPLRDYVRSLWQRREFAWSAARGEVQTAHLDTLLGNAWHLLNPLLLIGVYYLVFGVVLDITRGLPEGLFLPFLAVGVFTYQFMQKTINAGARTISSNQGLIRSLQFPRALLPIATVLSGTMAYGSAFVVMVAVVLLSGQPLTLEWLLLPLVVAPLLVFTLGGTFISARLTDKVRDLENILPFLFRLGFYGSGVIFSVDGYLTNPAYRRLFLANPFYVYITLVRDVMMVEYTTEYLVWLWSSAIAWAVVVFVVGLLIFRAGEREYGRG
ncbi:ABC transporter permease [Nitriliruptor alkaliphilus]|uniref:ABC transporter permease n=1 Tax=Nitriliruptor alkaliphilus TaxID=427918 RepID=UPI00146FCD6A|nr:ABC transporter permease [Nitriliruptor alkaliphilus]